MERTAVSTPATYEPVGQVLTAERYDALPENETVVASGLEWAAVAVSDLID